MAVALVADHLPAVPARGMAAAHHTCILARACRRVRDFAARLEAGELTTRHLLVKTDIFRACRRRFTLGRRSRGPTGKRRRTGPASEGKRERAQRGATRTGLTLRSRRGSPKHVAGKERRERAQRERATRTGPRRGSPKRRRRKGDASERSEGSHANEAVRGAKPLGVS